jgi:hypothetical protein
MPVFMAFPKFATIYTDFDEAPELKITYSAPAPQH